MAEGWKDFYVMAGGAAAALTGLILVAVSLHLKAVLTPQSPTARAIDVVLDAYLLTTSTMTR